MRLPSPFAGSAKGENAILTTGAWGRTQARDRRRPCPIAFKDGFKDRLG